MKNDYSGWIIAGALFGSATARDPWQVMLAQAVVGLLIAAPILVVLHFMGKRGPATVSGDA